MLKFFLFYMLLALSLGSAFAKDEDSFDYYDIAAPEPLIQHNVCVQYKKRPHCLQPGVCMAVSGATIAVMSKYATQSGYPYVGAIIPSAFMFVGDYCKKQHCFDLSHCVRWSVTM